MQKEDIPDYRVGQRIGRRVILAGPFRKKRTGPRFLMRCDCGDERLVYRAKLLRGLSGACNSCTRKAYVERTGQNTSKKSEYKIWQHMRRRCNNPRAVGYKNYGGRGIRVCKEWDHPNGFQAFFSHIGPRPSDQHQIDRIDNNGNYEPGNVRWATRRENNRHTRHSRMLTYDGETQPLIYWSEKFGLPPSTIMQRLGKGLTIEEALTLPVIKSACRRGHSLTGDNLVSVSTRPHHRACKTCRQMRNERREQKQQLSLKAGKCQYCHSKPLVKGRNGCKDCLFRNRIKTRVRRGRPADEHIKRLIGAKGTE